MEHVQIQLAKPGGGFHERSNGIDSGVAAQWIADGRARLVPTNDEAVVEDPKEKPEDSESSEADSSESDSSESKMDAFKVDELLEFAEQLGIPGRTKMKKSELIEAIEAASEE